MMGYEFADEKWSLLIWVVVAFVVILVWLDQRGRVGLERFLSSPMQKRLVNRPKRSRRLMRILLLGACGLFLVLALMRPQSGRNFIHTPRIGAQVMVCLDVSRSMLAEDVAPNRLERSKVEILDLLAYMDRDHVGLIAFAGKAIVLCPLTPDFGFLRLALESAGPHSVARGGTNLEAPIRKAVKGFRGQSDLSRTIILITDGGDQDTFPLEAAKAATERGIRIIAIGFGDEAGSQVMVTDPMTGARTQLLDGNGESVVSSLDSELLSEIALETDGVYVPAGTGSLDLNSIFTAHIAPLTRGRLDDHRRLVMQERYQWAVLAALICVVAAATVASGRTVPQGPLPEARAGATKSVAAFIIVLTMTIAAPNAQGQTAAPTAIPIAADEVDPIDQKSEVEDQSTEDPEKDVDPRQAYNDGLVRLANNELDAAESHFSLVRRRAGTDAQARYRATYNMGWVEIKRADELIKEKPQEALPHLQSAAGWFRDAVRLQSDEPAPRENLQIVTRRAMALADALAKHDKVDLKTRLDELIQQQRQLTSRLQDTVERVDDLEQPVVTEDLRQSFRALEVEQRKLLALTNEAAQIAREEVESLESSEEEPTTEQRIRVAQLKNVQAYLYEASQRIGQTRRHLRARQAERAYRRSSVALGQLKRARDQLRNFVEVLGAVISDALGLAQQTALLAASDSQFSVGSQGPKKPNWLTREFLQDSIDTVRERTSELVARVEAGLNQPESSDDEQILDPDDAADTDQDGPDQEDSDREYLLTTLREAEPHIHQARDAFKTATEALSSQRDEEAFEAESRATAQLIKARELFLDIRGLIEVLHADQKRVQTLIAALEQGIADEDASIEEYLPLLGQSQTMNIHRGQRLDRLLDRQLSGLDVQPAPNESNGQEETDTATQRQQFELAKHLLSLVMQSFGDVEQATQDLKEDDSDSQRLRRHVDQSVEHIESLRRLFFSIVEHLRETARRQVELSDETRDVSALTDESELQASVAPLSIRQMELSRISQQIAESLKQQAEQSPPATGTSETPGMGAGPPVGPTDANHASAAPRLLQASQRVDEATHVMDQAADEMVAETLDLKVAQEHQATAVQKLAEALELLAPQPPPQQNQPPQDQQQEQQQQESGSENEEQTQSPSAQQLDMASLLQAVRDREAQRQRQKRMRQPSEYAPVEKDW